MSSLLGITMSPALQFVASFAFVIMLIIVTLVLARNFGLMPGGSMNIGKSRANRLSISEVMTLDGRRKLVLIRRDGVEHLLLLGGTQDMMVEAAIEKPNRDKSAKPKEEASDGTIPTFNDEGYKITSWSVPVTSGSAPQIHLSSVKNPVTEAQIANTAEARQELRPSIEDEVKTQQLPIAQIVEKARDAAIQAVSTARSQGAEALKHISVSNKPLVSETKPVAEQKPIFQVQANQNTNGSQRITIKSESKPDLLAKATLSTQNYVEKAAAMNAAMEEQIRALTKIPTPKGVISKPAAEPDQIKAPAQEMVANTNKPEPAEPAKPLAPAPRDKSLEEKIAATLLIDDPVQEPTNVININAEKPKKATATEMAFFSVFGEPKTPDQPKEEEDDDASAKIAEAKEPRSYMDVLEAATPKMKSRTKKVDVKAKEEAVEPHPTYAKPASKKTEAQSLSEDQFDDLEMELAKLLQSPQGRR